MNMPNFSGYLALFNIGIKNQMAYKADYLVSLIFGILRPLIMLAVWGVVYAATESPSIAGFTLASTAAYFFLAVPITISTNAEVIDIMQDDIDRGAIASSRIKPMSYPINVLFRSLSSQFVDMVLLVLPLIIISVIAFHLTPTPVTILLFIAEILIAMAFVHTIEFFIGTMAIRLTNIYGLAITLWETLFLLSGGTVPLNFFPSSVQQILMLSPFPVVCYLPVVTLLGTISQAQIISSSAFALAWTLVLLALAYFWWKFLSKSLGVAGG